MYRNARVAAAQRDTSLSALVGEYLEQLSGRMDESPGWRRCSTRCRPRSASSARLTGSAATRSTTVRFVDTNVLLYAISRDPAEQDKAKRANDILAGRDLALSVQVLQEFYVQATRASRPDPITHQQAVRLIESFRRFPVRDITTAILMAALDTRQRFQISYWDSAIIEASRAMGCAEVLSEDLGDGQDYAGVRVVNPFRCIHWACVVMTCTWDDADTLIHGG